MKKTLFILLIIIVSCLFLLASLKKTKETKTIVKFSSWGSQSETELLKPLLKEFEKQNPDIKIEFIHIPQNYFQKLHLLFASNLAPDVVFINNYYAPKYIQSGLLEDLTPFFNKNEYFKKSYEGFCFNNKIYAIPRDVSNLVVYYNKDLFKRYDAPYPSNNWSIEDYIKTAKQLTKDTNNDKKTDIWGTSFEKDVIFWLPYLFSNNASILSDDGSTILINKKESILYV